MEPVLLSGTGIYIPENSITNEELTSSHNQYVREYNAKNRHAIDHGALEPLIESKPDFILQASGIGKRHVLDKEGILNTSRMHPVFPKRNNSELSLQSEIAVHAAKQALIAANKQSSDIDLIIVACSNFERPYPAIAIEVQAALNTAGFAYDVNAACSSASFGIQLAYHTIKSGGAHCALVISPEIYTGHVNFRDRRSHFIFGDGCSAVIIERESKCQVKNPYKILGAKLKTQFSNNIRNNNGFLSRCKLDDTDEEDKLFTQIGKAVREQVVPMAQNHILNHLSELSIAPSTIKKLWLHQANIHINNAIAQGIWGREPTKEEAPTILEQYGNLGAAGVIVTFHQNNQNLGAGDIGVLCSFGAGYAVGSIVLQKM